MGRHDTSTGLTTTIKDLGVVTPIHVMTTEESTMNSEDDEESGETGYKYMLLDGVRRLIGALRNGHKEVDAVIWDFEDKERVQTMLLLFHLY